MQSLWLGTLDFGTAWELQKAVAAWRSQPNSHDVLLLLEHPPTITLGRGANPSNILAGPHQLSSMGVQVIPIDRGGDVTCHWPGQLVGYPICDLRARGRDLHRFLRDIEHALLNLVLDYGIEARRFPPHTGIWVGEEKLAAIGVHVSRWISTHGFALNVSVDLRCFSLIVPCGLRDFGVTSLERLLGVAPTVEQVARRAADHFSAVFGNQTVPGASLPIPNEYVRWATAAALPDG